MKPLKIKKLSKNFNKSFEQNTMEFLQRLLEIFVKDRNNNLGINKNTQDIMHYFQKL